MAQFDAILPAGGRIDPAFAQIAGTDNKALIEFQGKTILETVLSSLNESGLVNRTVLVGPEVVRNHPAAQNATIKLEEAKTGPDNIFKGLDYLMNSENPPHKVLIATTDLPFLTPQIVRDFLNMCPDDREIVISLVNESAYTTRFPGSSSTFIRLKDDCYTAGCLFILNVDAMRRCRRHIDNVFMNRKSKIGLAKLLGPVFVAKWLMKKLSLTDVENKIQSLLGCSGTAVTTSPPELAFDIDFLDDYEYAVKAL